MEFSCFETAKCYKEKTQTKDAQKMNNKASGIEHLPWERLILSIFLTI